jgi:hypothetical protein
MDHRKKELKNKIDNYIKKCKSKYFNREDINELKILLESVNSYIDNEEIENNKKYKYINNENILLKSKLEAIKINLENNVNVQGTLIYLDNLKNDENIIVRTFLKMYLYIFYILFYVLTIYNNKKIRKKIS